MALTIWHIKRAGYILALTVCACSLSGCFVAQQLHDKQGEEKLLKPGVLDPALTERYRTYSYKFLNRLQVSHDWLANANPCHYNRVMYQPPGPRWKDGSLTMQVVRYGDIYENDNKTLQEVFNPEFPETRTDYRWLSIDRYVRSKVVINPVGGQPVETGLQPMCYQTWTHSSHVLTIKLFKRTASEWQEVLANANPTGVFSVEQVGDNRWYVQRTALTVPRLNSVGGAYQSWTLPVADTGYTLTLQLGASLKSLEHPERHAQMQANFRHLIESVRIEPVAD